MLSQLVIVVIMQRPIAPSKRLVGNFERYLVNQQVLHGESWELEKLIPDGSHT
jgi:regulatory protein YycI of two-component signal transduction system YycFG